MKKMQSYRLDEKTIKFINFYSKELGISKSEFIEKTISYYIIKKDIGGIALALGLEKDI